MRFDANAALAARDVVEIHPASLRPAEGSHFVQNAKNVGERTNYLPRTLKATGNIWSKLGPELIEMEIVTDGVAYRSNEYVALSAEQLNRYYVRAARPGLAPV